MAREHQQAALARLLASLAVCALVAIAADTPRNQAENRKLKLEATAVTDPKLVAQEVGVMLGTGYIVVKLRATPLGPDPLPLSPDDFTLVSRKDGEKSGALPSEGFVNPEIEKALKQRVFTASEGKVPIEGLLYFRIDNSKPKPSQLGMIYAGKAGRLIVDFK